MTTQRDIKSASSSLEVPSELDIALNQQAAKGSPASTARAKLLTRKAPSDSSARAETLTDAIKAQPLGTEFDPVFVKQPCPPYENWHPIDVLVEFNKIKRGSPIPLSSVTPLVGLSRSERDLHRQRVECLQENWHFEDSKAFQRAYGHRTEEHRHRLLAHIGRQQQEDLDRLLQRMTPPKETVQAQDAKAIEEDEVQAKGGLSVRDAHIAHLQQRQRVVATKHLESVQAAQQEANSATKGQAQQHKEANMGGREETTEDDWVIVDEDKEPFLMF